MKVIYIFLMDLKDASDIYNLFNEVKNWQLTDLCGERSELLFVDGSLIDGVRNREVDEFTATTKKRQKLDVAKKKLKIEVMDKILIKTEYVISALKNRWVEGLHEKDFFSCMIKW